MQFVVLRNPLSSKNRAGKTKPYPPHIKPIELTDTVSLPVVLEDLKADHVDCIIIDGGDGTVREVLTHLPAIYGANLPLIGILAHGNTNLIARKGGALRNPAALLGIEALSAQECKALTRSMPMLRLDFDGKDRPSLRGFMMGWGVYASATRFAIDENASTGIYQVLSVFFTMLKLTLWQGQKGSLRQGIPLQLNIDDKPTEEAHRFIGLATTLSGSLIAGLNPFWGKGEGAIRWTDVLAPAPYLLPASLIAATGRHMKWMSARGYDSGRADKFDLTIEAPLVLDGEIVPIDGKMKISISAEEKVDFIAM